MSQERDEIRVNGLPGTPIKSEKDNPPEDDPTLDSDDLEIENGEDVEIDEEMDQEYKVLTPQERKARLATVLDRGVVHERLRVDLPPQLHGEWVRADPMEVQRMRTLGFWVDNQYSTKRAIHSDGASGNTVGDVIYMVTTRDNKDLIDEVRLEQQLKSARVPKEAQEEILEKRLVDREIPTFSESNQRSVTADDVRAALRKVDGQIAVQR